MTAWMGSRMGRDDHQLLEDLVESLIEGVALIDKDGVIRYTNASCDAMFGYARGELLGKPFCVLNADSQEQSQPTTEAIMALLAQQQSWQGEVRTLRKDGSQFWAESRISSFRHPRLDRVWGAVQWDVTTSKRQLDYVVDALVEAILVIGDDGRIVRTNSRVTEIFGYTRDELIGKRVEILMPERYRGGHVDFRTQFNKAPRTRMMGSNRELFGMRKDASEFPVEVGLGLMQFGNTEYTVASIVDISQRRRLEHDVQWYEAIVQSSKDAIIGISLDGSVTSWNHGAQTLFGFAAEEMIGGSLLKLLPESRQEEEAAILTRLRQGEAVSHYFNTVHLRKDGSLVDVSVSISPIRDVHGRAIGASKIARDISDWKSKELEIADLNSRLARALVSTTNILEDTKDILQERTRELASTLARQANAERLKVEAERKRLSLEMHDEIGQMLAALNINLEMLRRRQNNPEAGEPLENSIKITASLVKTVRRIVHQLRPLQLDEFGLVAAVREHIEMIRKHSMIDVTLNEDLGSTRLPRAVELACFRIVQESLTNVMRHASACHVEVRLTRSADALHLSVSDDGVGMEPADSPPGGPETGHLGLHGMRERTQSLGGSFQVSTEPGQGCRIIAVIPLTYDSASPGQATK